MQGIEAVAPPLIALPGISPRKTGRKRLAGTLAFLLQWWRSGGNGGHATPLFWQIVALLWHSHAHCIRHRWPAVVAGQYTGNPGEAGERFHRVGVRKSAPQWLRCTR
ncbi:hypothetical protein [Mesorhizobium sp. B261B1A]|uniref:hypothetical protein n=1 Tax=Mesorhizobium sp. B261B1A TaxID=2876671 RepID=UPI001CD05165|nr:hypothetical protein [Mesorhizobium sp. B261B1A]MCA0058861.1 hypothetical protein [Mesorhizobium sp. B261B1A]